MWTFYNASGEAMIIDGGLSNVVEDTTPQLGGNLDMQASLLVGNGGSTGIAISANGEVTMAAQPAVSAYNSSTDTDVTGNNTHATVTFDSEIFDQNADFASNTFTAPITGRYLMSMQIQLVNITSSATSTQCRIITSNRTYLKEQGKMPPDGSGRISVDRTTIVDMDASDTMTITTNVLGEGSDVIEIEGSASSYHTIITVCLLA
jgi:hypothetical protein